jgi:hypothetical protein
MKWLSIQASEKALKTVVLLHNNAPAGTTYSENYREPWDRRGAGAVVF